MIRCRHCQRDLPAESFPPDPSKRNGLDSWCRDCHVAAVRAWRAAHREDYNAKQRGYYAKAKARR